MAKSNLKIEGMGFENFRIFKNRMDMDFRPITVLTGTNSSGKSTVINAIRLLKSNYNGLPFSRHPSEFELDSIFSKKFDVGDILQRFGNLENFVSFNSGTEFTFSLQKEMRMTERLAVIDFTIQIEDNDLKNGRLVRLEMKSKLTGQVFFSIKETKAIEEEKKEETEKVEKKSGIIYRRALPLEYRDRHITTINLHGLYDHYLKWINKNVDYYKELIDIEKLVIKFNDEMSNKDELDDMAEAINIKYDSDIMIIGEIGKYQVHNYSDLYDVPFTNDIIDRKKFVEIIGALQEGKFYDFSILWTDDEKKEELFKKMIANVYGKYDTNSLERLTEDILDFLSKVKWQYSAHEHMIMESNFQYSEAENLKLEYLYFNKPYSFIKHNYIDGLSLNDYVERYGDQGISPEEYNKTIEGRYEKKSYLSPEIIEEVKSKDDLLKFLTTQNRINYNPTAAEKNFYQYFLFHNLNLIKEVFRPFKETEFISTAKSGSKRVKLLSDEDDLSRLSKKRFSLDKQARDKIDAFLNKWLFEFDIAEEIIFYKDPDLEVYKIFIKKNNQKILLDDMGFGVSQLLPTMLSCCMGSKIVAIEEPETNLHPAVQSKLADFFIDAAAQFNIQFIIETHSEYLIRKLQYLTKNTDSNLETDDTVIYYFFQSDKVPVGEYQVKKININADGSLTDDFGSGFFDEALHWKFELIKLTNPQKN